ncbi:MAG TPA: hypothetical protein VN695_10320 [Streptosporangiaceae bacterium]|nr:hypothetical protein [Streptosporangiaceae bacterium]
MHGSPGHSFAVATLVSWLATEAFGGYMLTSWIGRGGHRVNRDVPGAVPRSVIFGHAGLAFTGLVSWICFVVTGDAPLAWLSIGLLAPAIGLGVGALTLWTPYSAHSRPGAGTARRRYDGMIGITTDEMLVAALEDDALTNRLVDELVASVLDRPEPTPRRPRWWLSPLVPAAHGVLATGTMLFAVLAAVSTS